jgi:hypothetical protein
LIAGLAGTIQPLVQVNATCSVPFVHSLFTTSAKEIAKREHDYLGDLLRSRTGLLRMFSNANGEGEKMSYKHKMTTVIWCATTMAGTMVLSHGHLIMKEILRNWPIENSWEGRFENALYTQGGLALLASVVLSAAILIRGWLGKKRDEEIARRERLQREKHERAESERHAAMIGAIEMLGEGILEKKSAASGVKPR